MIQTPLLEMIRGSRPKHQGGVFAFETVRPMAEIDDFAGTAALIEALDLVIAVDTAVAHLAGALGKPVWLLSRFNGCWRWLLDRPDSPWYPTLILYRQNSLGDWEEVLGRVARDLERLATPAISPAQRTG